MKTYAVYLGRFCPLHKGHQKIIDTLIKKYGLENVIIMIGSSTSRNKRTPYSFTTRKKMIEILYPKIKIIGLPDGNPKKIFFGEETTDIWLESIKKIEKEFNAKFKFFGGSIKDLEILSRSFETEIIFNRDETKLSATQIREFMDKGEYKKLDELVDKKIVRMVIEEYKKFP